MATRSACFPIYTSTAEKTLQPSKSGTVTDVSQMTLSACGVIHTTVVTRCSLQLETVKLLCCSVSRSGWTHDPPFEFQWFGLNHDAISDG